MAGFTPISILSIGLVLFIITIHVLVAGVIGLRFTRQQALLSLAVLSLITYGFLWIAAIPVGLWVGFSPPYGPTPEDEVLRVIWGILYLSTLVRALGANISYDLGQSLNVLLGVGLLFLLGLPSATLMKQRLPQG